MCIRHIYFINRLLVFGFSIEVLYIVKSFKIYEWIWLWAGDVFHELGILGTVIGFVAA